MVFSSTIQLTRGGLSVGILLSTLRRCCHSPDHSQPVEKNVLHILCTTVNNRSTKTSQV